MTTGDSPKYVKRHRNSALSVRDLALLALTFVLTAAAPANAWGQDVAYVYPGAQWEMIATPEEAGYSSEVLERVRKYADALETTGLMVVVGGRVLLQHGDVEQLSYLASVRKSILAMLYGRYVEDGTINLNWTLDDLGMDDIGGLLPVERQATVEHLITARSGVYHPASNAGDNSADAPDLCEFIEEGWNCVFEGTERDAIDPLLEEYNVNCGGGCSNVNREDH